MGFDFLTKGFIIIYHYLLLLLYIYTITYYYIYIITYYILVVTIVIKLSHT